MPACATPANFPFAIKHLRHVIQPSCSELQTLRPLILSIGQTCGSGGAYDGAHHHPVADWRHRLGHMESAGQYPRRKNGGPGRRVANRAERSQLRTQAATRRKQSTRPQVAGSRSAAAASLPERFGQSSRSGEAALPIAHEAGRSRTAFAIPAPFHGAARRDSRSRSRRRTAHPNRANDRR